MYSHNCSHICANALLFSFLTDHISVHQIRKEKKSPQLKNRLQQTSSPYEPTYVTHKTSKLALLVAMPTTSNINCFLPNCGRGQCQILLRLRRHGWSSLISHGWLLIIKNSVTTNCLPSNYSVLSSTQRNTVDGSHPCFYSTNYYANTRVQITIFNSQHNSTSEVRLGLTRILTIDRILLPPSFSSTWLPSPFTERQSQTTPCNRHKHIALQSTHN